MIKEVENWMKQAREDISSSEKNIEIGKYYVSAFLSQQTVEKALKGFYIQEKGELLKTHDISLLSRELNLPQELIEKIAILEPVYQITRYPDVENKIPAEEIGENNATEFYNIAQEVLKWIEEKLK